MEPFKFDLKASRTRFTDREILDGLRRFAATLNNRAFTAHQFNSWSDRPFNAMCASRRFGSWRAALLKIGVSGARGRYSPQDLITNLENVWREMGRPPGQRHLRRRGNFSIGPYRRHWGGVRTACERLAAYKAGTISHEELLRYIPPAQRSYPSRAPIPVSLRWRILKRDGHRCVSCGTGPAVDASVQLQIDHIVPVSKGGGNEEGNLRVLCRACNAGKGVGQ